MTIGSLKSKLQCFFSALTLCLFLSNTSVVHAEEQPLNIATIPLPPWGFVEAPLGSQGICYEWANAIAERMGRKYTNRIMPMSRLFKALEYGRIDFSIFLRTPFSESIAVPIANVGIPFRTVILPKKDLSIKSFEDLNGVRLSMARGLKVGGEFANQKDLNITYSADYAHSVQMFKAGRIDAIVGTQQSLIYNAFKLGLNPNQVFSMPFELAQLEGWVQASNEFIAREGMENLQIAAQSLIDDGTFLAIFKKYNHALTASLNN